MAVSLPKAHPRPVQPRGPCWECPWKGPGSWRAACTPHHCTLSAVIREHYIFGLGKLWLSCLFEILHFLPWMLQERAIMWINSPTFSIPLKIPSSSARSKILCFCLAMCLDHISQSPLWLGIVIWQGFSQWNVSTSDRPISRPHKTCPQASSRPLPAYECGPGRCEQEPCTWAGN